MNVDVKEEPPIEIEEYMLVDAAGGQNVSYSEEDPEIPKKKRKRSKKGEKIASFNGNDEMQQLLRKWGLEVLCERFSKNLIDVSVLEYIMDVDIVDLCRDLPIRYRLLLRHKLAEKNGKRAQSLHSNGCVERTNVWRSMSAYEKSRGEPLQIKSDNHFPKQAKCPIDMLLDRPFANRTGEEKSLLISMDIPRPHMPHLKSVIKKKDNSTVTRNFYRTSYESAWWLCGSQKRNKLFCWPCLLFIQPTDPSNSVWGKRGFNDLNHLSSSVKGHSASQRHIDNANAYKNFGQPLASMDNDKQSGSATESDANNSIRKPTGNPKTAAGDNIEHSTDEKPPVLPNTTVPLKDYNDLTATKLKQEFKFESPPPDLSA